MKISKATLAAAVMLVSLASLRPLALAADKPEATKPEGPRPERREQVRDRLETMSKELNLADEQKAKLKTLFQQEAEKARAVRQDTNLTPEQKREKARAIR